MTAPRVRIVDTTLRDGSHAIAHQFRVDQVRTIAEVLDRAGVWAIAVGHGDGLGANSLQYGRPRHPDVELLRAAAEVVHAGRDRGRDPAGHRHQARPRRGPRCRCDGRPGVDGVHRGRHRPAAPRPRARTRNDRAHAPEHRAPARSGRAGRAGPNRGRRRQHRRVHRRFGRCVPDRRRPAQRGRHAQCGARRRRDRHARAQQPLPRGGQLRRRDRGGGDAGRRLARRSRGRGPATCQTEALVAVLDKMGISTGVDLWTLQDAADTSCAAR